MNSLSHEKELLSLQREVMEKEKLVLDLQRKSKSQNLNLSDLNSSQNLSAKASNERLAAYEQKIEKLHQQEQSMRSQITKLEIELEHSKRNLVDNFQRQGKNESSIS